MKSLYTSTLQFLTSLCKRSYIHVPYKERHGGSSFNLNDSNAKHTCKREEIQSKVWSALLNASVGMVASGGSGCLQQSRRWTLFSSREFTNGYLNCPRWMSRKLQLLALGHWRSLHSLVLRRLLATEPLLTAGNFVSISPSCSAATVATRCFIAAVLDWLVSSWTNQSNGFLKVVTSQMRMQ